MVSKDVKSQVSKFLTDYFENREPLRLVILLVDIRREVQELDKDIVEVREESLFYCDIYYNSIYLLTT